MPGCQDLTRAGLRGSWTELPWNHPEEEEEEAQRGVSSLGQVGGLGRESPGIPPARVGCPPSL